MANAFGKSPVLVGSFSRSIGKGVSALFLQAVGQSLREMHRQKGLVAFNSNAARMRISRSKKMCGIILFRTVASSGDERCAAGRGRSCSLEIGRASCRERGEM